MVFNFRKNKKMNAETDTNSESGSEDQTIVIDGRGYEKDTPVKEEIYDLKDVVDDDPMEDRLHEAMLSRLDAIVEKVAREKVPEIAERIIREEIEKLKENL